MPRIQFQTSGVGRQFRQVFDDYVTKTQRNATEVLRDKTTRLRELILAIWPVDTYASRGGWRGPIVSQLGSDTIGFKLENHFVYAAVIEFGLYPGVGPKTANQPGQRFAGGIDVGKGIFPTQKPHAPVRRSMSQIYLQLLGELVKAGRI